MKDDLPSIMILKFNFKEILKAATEQDKLNFS